MLICDFSAKCMNPRVHIADSGAILLQRAGTAVTSMPHDQSGLMINQS